MNDIQLQISFSRPTYKIFQICQARYQKYFKHLKPWEKLQEGTISSIIFLPSTSLFLTIHRIHSSTFSRISSDRIHRGGGIIFSYRLVEGSRDDESVTTFLLEESLGCLMAGLPGVTSQPCSSAFGRHLSRWRLQARLESREVIARGDVKRIRQAPADFRVKSFDRNRYRWWNRGKIATAIFCLINRGSSHPGLEEGQRKDGWRIEDGAKLDKTRGEKYVELRVYVEKWIFLRSVNLCCNKCMILFFSFLRNSSTSEKISLNGNWRKK